MSLNLSKQLKSIAFLSLVAMTASAAPKAPQPFSVRVSGKAASPANRPIVFIAGLDSSGEVWADTAKHLARTHEVHVLTLAGFAGEPAVAMNEGAWLDTMRTGLVTYLREKQLNPAIVVGHSIGGFLALAAGVEAPELFSRLVIVEGLPFAPAVADATISTESSEPQGRMMRDLLKSQDRETFTAGLQSSLFYMVSDPAKRKAVFLKSAKSSISTTAEAMYSMMATDLRSGLPHITCPVLMLAAGNGQDVKGVIDMYTTQVKNLPNVTVAANAQSKHFMMLDVPEFVIAQVDAFIAEHE